MRSQLGEGGSAVKCARKAGDALHPTRQSLAGAVFRERLERRRPAVVQKLAQIPAHHETARRVVGRGAIEQRGQHAKLHVGTRRRRRAALREAPHAVFRSEERTHRLQRRAHVGGILGVQLVGQKRQEVGLEMVGEQLHVGQPIALDVAAGALAVHQQIACNVAARNQALHLEHAAFRRLHEAHGPREPLARRHNAISCAHAIKAALGQAVERVLELAGRIVPNHDATRSRRRKRLREPRLQLPFNIYLRHMANTPSHGAPQRAEHSCNPHAAPARRPAPVLLDLRQHVLELRVAHFHAVV